jgi:hypothetical protein
MVLILWLAVNSLCGLVAVITHGMPKRLISVPNRFAQKVFSSGIRIVPFLANA